MHSTNRGSSGEVRVYIQHAILNLGLVLPDRSPSPPKVITDSNRIGAEEDIDEYKGLTEDQIKELITQRESKANAQILEMVGDIPDADAKPPENILFVCTLNPVTTDEDLEIIFSRFGPILSCEVIRDQKTGDSLQYAFIEFENEEDCIQAYFKMDNVLIDDRRIHVDFSQSLSKVKGINKRKYSEEVPDEDGKKSDKKNDGLVARRKPGADGYEMVFGNDDAGGDIPSGRDRKDRRNDRGAGEIGSGRRDADDERRGKREGSRRDRDGERSSKRRERDGERRHHHRRSRSRSRERHSSSKHKEKTRRREYSRSRSRDRKHHRK